MTAYNALADPPAMQTIAEALNSSNAATGLYELGLAVNASMALHDLGLAEADLERAADLAVQNPYWNPHTTDRESIHALLKRAWAGDPPSV